MARPRNTHDPLTDAQRDLVVKAIPIAKAFARKFAAQWGRIPYKDVEAQALYLACTAAQAFDGERFGPEYFRPFVWLHVKQRLRLGCLAHELTGYHSGLLRNKPLRADVSIEYLPAEVWQQIEPRCEQRMSLSEQRRMLRALAKRANLTDAERESVTLWAQGSIPREAATFGITPQRLRQIAQRAIAKLQRVAVKDLDEHKPNSHRV